MYRNYVTELSHLYHLTAKCPEQRRDPIASVLLKKVRGVVEQDSLVPPKDALEVCAFSFTEGKVFHPPHDQGWSVRQPLQVRFDLSEVGDALIS